MGRPVLGEQWLELSRRVERLELRAAADVFAVNVDLSDKARIKVNICTTMSALEKWAHLGNSNSTCADARCEVLLHR